MSKGVKETWSSRRKTAMLSGSDCKQIKGTKTCRTKPRKGLERGRRQWQRKCRPNDTITEGQGPEFHTEELDTHPRPITTCSRLYLKLLEFHT